jgi:leader peptidase (prepilin peptidase)/N-methyltransferase
MLVGAVVMAVLCWSIGLRPELPAYLPAGASGVVLAFVDLRCLRLPNAVVGRTLLAVLVLLAVAAAAEGHWGALVRALLGGAVLFSGYLLLHLISPASLGRGDVNLSAVLGLCLGWLGWGSVLVGFCAASLAGLPVSLYLLCFRSRDRRPQIPYGPYLLVGALVAVALH